MTRGWQAIRSRHETGAIAAAAVPQFDHIIPRACGDADNLSNMQWQTDAEAKAKNKSERVNCQGR